MKHKKSVKNVLSPKTSSKQECPDIKNQNGDIRFIHSFQFQLIKSTMLSLLLTVLTDISLILLVFLVLFASRNFSEEKRPPSNEEYSFSGIEGNEIEDNNSYDYTDAIKNYLAKKEPLEEHFPSAKKLIRKQQLQKLLLLLFFMVICSLALFIFYFLLLTRHFSSYLVEITSGINKIAEGDFDHQIPVRTKDELGMIAGCINEMSEQIEETIELERKTEQEKNQLITSVAHDIRTPLTSILGYLELLLHKSEEKELFSIQSQEYLRIAYDKSLRLMTLTEDLFTYTKVSFGELKIQKQSLDLIMFLEQMMEEFYPSFIENGLDCQFTHSINSIPFRGDSSMLARAFSNLLSNAVKYGKDGKELLITADILADSAIIKITNYGMIIPDNALTHIFDRFYRVENSRSLDTGGSGLGLSIAQRVIRLHNGTIRAISGKDGTSFIVTLPLNSESNHALQLQKQVQK